MFVIVFYIGALSGVLCGASSNHSNLIIRIIGYILTGFSIYCILYVVYESWVSEESFWFNVFCLSIGYCLGFVEMYSRNSDKTKKKDQKLNKINQEKDHKQREEFESTAIGSTR